MARSTTSASTRVSARARLSPLAPVGGTVCAASPASSSRPLRIGVWTKERNGSTVRSITGPSFELESVGPGQPRLQLAPDPVVGPGVRVLGRVALEVHPLHGVGALADQREAPVRARVDQLGCRAGRLAQDPEPGERVLPDVAAPPLHVVAADRAGAVGAHDEVGGHLVRPPVAIDVRHPRPVGVEVVHGRVGDPVAQVAAVTGAGGVEVDEDVGLRVEPHRGADQLLEVDVVALAAEAQVDAAVPVAVGDHPLVAARVDARLGEQPHAVALEDAGAVGRADLLDRAVVDHDALDARAVQQVRQHQPRGAAADDRDLACGWWSWVGR